MSVDHLKQALGAEESAGRVEVYVDSNWAPERNNDRRSLSGCVILVDRFPVKAFCSSVLGRGRAHGADRGGKGGSWFDFLSETCLWAREL